MLFVLLRVSWLLASPGGIGAKLMCCELSLGMLGNSCSDIGGRKTGCLSHGGGWEWGDIQLCSTESCSNL